MKKYHVSLILVFLLVFLVPLIHAQWTSKVVDSVNDGFQVNVQIEYNNGIKTLNKKYTLLNSPTLQQDLQSIIADDINNLNGLNNSTIALGNITGVKPIHITTPQENFVIAVNHLKSAKLAVDLGIITTSSQEYKDALSSVVSQYQPQFLNLFQ